MNKENKEKKGNNKIKIAALFGIAIFAFSIFGFAMISTSYMPASNNRVHIHATLSIENVNMLNLKTYSDFMTPPVLHLHFMTTTKHIAIVHMEGYPTPINVFFNSIGFNTTGYILYVNDKEVGYNYVFKNGDLFNLMLKNTSIDKALVTNSEAHRFFKIFSSGNVTKLKAFKL